MLFTLFLIFCLAGCLSCAISAAQVIEVRTTGSDTNGGGYKFGATGTDYSQQNSAQIAVTDVVANGTTTITSATAGFGATHVGNLAYLSGGSGSLTATRREILSVTNSTTAVVDATVAAGTGITMNLGGALASPGMAASFIVANNTVWIKSGTYLLSNTANVSGGKVAPAVASWWRGYVSTRGDAVIRDANLPVLKANANSVAPFAAAANDVEVSDIECDGNTANFTSTTCFSPTSNFRTRLYNCRARNSGSSGFGTSGIFWWYFCEAINCADGFRGNGYGLGCLSRGNSSNGYFVSAGNSAFALCAAHGNSLHGFTMSFPVHAYGCVSVGNTNSGFNINGAGTQLTNCIAYGNGAYGFATLALYDVFLLKCAAGTNTSGSVQGGTANIPAANQVGLVSLTNAVDPFVNAAAFNFALDSTKADYALLKSLGFGTFPGSTSSSFDIGCAQHADPAALARTLSMMTLGF